MGSASRWYRPGLATWCQPAGPTPRPRPRPSPAGAEGTDPPAGEGTTSTTCWFTRCESCPGFEKASEEGEKDLKTLTTQMRAVYDIVVVGSGTTESIGPADGSG